MKLWQTFLSNIVGECVREIISELNIEKLFECECYLLLERIRSILEYDEYEDSECFDRIEKIVREFEKIGSDCGTRHDFG